MELSLPLVLESMIPLYFGFIASFVSKTKDMTSQEAEDVIEDLCLEFEKQTEDVSYGRAPDGGQWTVLSTPTPGTANIGNSD